MRKQSILFCLDCVATGNWLCFPFGFVAAFNVIGSKVHEISGDYVVAIGNGETKALSRLRQMTIVVLEGVC